MHTPETKALQKTSPRLLAVDLGLRCGLATFDAEGALLWYRSHNLGSRSRLKRAIEQLLGDADLAWVVVEGGDSFARPWKKAAERRSLRQLQIYAETWRPSLLVQKPRDGAEAKRMALHRARDVIEACTGPRPTSLRHDAAEAILIGYWALKEVGWRQPTLKRPRKKR